MAHTNPASASRGRAVAGVFCLVAGFLLASIALAPSAWSWHPESEAAVDCTDEQIVLQWRVVPWQQLWGPDFYNPDVRVYLQYGDADGAIGGLTDVQIGSGAFSATAGLEFSGTELLNPPAGATRVRVHADAVALWESGNATLPDESQTTAWLALPAACNGTTTTVEDTTTTTVEATTTTTVEATTTTTVDDTTTTTVEDTTTTTVEDTPTTRGEDPTTTTIAAPTSTTVAGGVDSTSSTTIAGGVLSESAQASGVTAQVVSAQAVPAQALPNTGSSTGVLLAGGVLLLSLGGGLVLASTRRMAG